MRYISGLRTGLLVCCLALLLWPSQGWGQIAFVNEQHNDSAATTSFAFSATVTANDTYVLGIGCGSGLCASLGVSDNGGNTWTVQAGAGNGGVIAHYTCLNCPNAATTITITTTSQPLNVGLFRYSGVGSIGNTNSATGTSTNPSVSVTTQDSNNYIAGVQTTNSEPGTVTAQNGTIRLNRFLSQQGSLFNTMIDNTAASPSSVTISVTQTNSTTWWIGAVELRAASSSSSRGLPLIGVGP